VRRIQGTTQAISEIIQAYHRNTGFVRGRQKLRLRPRSALFVREHSLHHMERCRSNWRSVSVYILVLLAKYDRLHDSLTRPIIAALKIPSKPRFRVDDSQLMLVLRWD